MNFAKHRNKRYNLLELTKRSIQKVSIRNNNRKMLKKTELTEELLGQIKNLR